MFCVYTCITGQYDQLGELPFSPLVDFFCFTNDPHLTSDTWTVIYIDIPNADHKRVKMLPHKYLPEKYTHSLWVDGSMRWYHDITKHLHGWVKEIALCSHPRTVAEEAVAIEYRRLTKVDTKAILAEYEKEGYDLNTRIHMGGIIYRKHTDRIRAFGESWYRELAKCNRDQISLDYCIWKHGLDVDVWPFDWSRAYIRRQRHNVTYESSTVHYMMPFSMNKRVGEVYNQACSRVPDGDWICIMDQDVLFDLGQNPQHIVSDAIRKYPDTDLFGCYTNRVGLKWQLLGEEADKNSDLLHHIEIARERARLDTCTQVDKPIAGFFMLFNKKLWETVKFQTHLEEKKVFFDWDFSQKILKSGGKIRLIDGLYVFHRYRMGKYINDLIHLKG